MNADIESSITVVCNMLGISADTTTKVGNSI